MRRLSRRVSVLLALGVALGLTTADAAAQWGRLSLPTGFDLDGTVRRWLLFQPITTSFKDAKPVATLAETFAPDQFFDLSTLPRTPEGNLVIFRPGAWRGVVQSYCLRSGTYGPSSGTGYRPIPLEGGQAEAVRAILQGTVVHPNVSQRDTQVLLWSIVDKLSYNKMPSAVKTTAQAYLTKKQLDALNDPILGSVPPWMRPLIEPRIMPIINSFEGQARHFAATSMNMQRQITGSSSYEAVERLAVLSGLAPEDPSVVPVPRGLWFRHSSGAYIRYQPENYSRTELQIFVPPDVLSERQTPLTLNLSTDLATPASTSNQRLGITSRSTDGEELSCLLPPSDPNFIGLTIYGNGTNTLDPLHEAIRFDTSNGPVTFSFGPRDCDGKNVLLTRGRIDEGNERDKPEYGCGYADIEKYGMRQITKYPMSRQAGDRVAAALRESASKDLYYSLIPGLSSHCHTFTCTVAAGGPSESDAAAFLRCLLPLDVKMVESWFR